MIKQIFQSLIIESEKFKHNGYSLIVLKFSKGVICLVLIVHFGIIFFSLSNDNPLKHQYKLEIESYVDPYFSQAWTLFAPNPINSNMTLLLNFTVVDGTGKTHEVGWLDISEPIIEHRKDNFFSPMQRINKFTQSCMSDVHQSYRVIREKLIEQTNVKTKEDSLQFITENIHIVENSHGHKSIISYSKSIAKSRLKELKIDSAKEIYVRYRILDMRFPRFSKRDLDYDDLDNYEISKTDSNLYKIF